MSEVSITDLISHAADESPEAFRQSFDQLMHDKVVAALDVRKQEVAANFFSQEAEEEVEDNNIDTDTQEDEEEDGQDS